MAVTGVLELFEGRSGSVDSKGQTALARVFMVRTDNLSDDAVTAIAYSGVPELWSVHPNSNKSFCVSRNATQMEDGYLWKVAVNYSSNMDTTSGATAPQTPEVAGQQKGSAPGERVENPLDRPTDVSYSISESSSVAYYDYHEPPKAYVNALKEKFDPPIEAPDPILNMSLEFNTASFSALEWLHRLKTVNDSTFFDFAPRTLMLDKVSAKRVYENGIKYWRVSIEVVINELTWDIQVLNHSYREKIAVTGFVQVASDKGIVLPNGVILDDAGYRLPLGTDPTLNNGGLIYFKKYKPVSYTWLAEIYNRII